MVKGSISISSQINDNTKLFLSELGLNDDQITTYLYLLQIGSSSVLSLSKAQRSGRTRLYPILESLVDLELVKVDQKHYGTTYDALSLQSLEYLVTKKETETKKLRDGLFDATEQLLSLSDINKGDSKVIEYRGLAGLKQVNFNLTKADKEFYVYELAHLDEHETIPQSFADRMRKLYCEKQLICFDLTNNEKWQKVISPLGLNGRMQKACYIDESIFKIRVETYIYNNVIAYCGYNRDEPFAVEIYNQELADQEKQIFKILWNMGEEIL